jgi:site-specific recombinase XerD
MNTTAKEKLLEIIQFIDGAYSASTIRAYKTNFESFIKFCEDNDDNALPAKSGIVASYIRKISDGHLKSSSIRIAIASISAIHRLNNLTDPTQHPEVRIEMRRMHRNLGREANQAYGITADLLKEMLSATEANIIGERDRTLLMVAYDTMCRRSELVSLRIEDIISKNGKVKIKLRKSKTDQNGQGKLLSISDKTAEQLKKWLEILKEDRGYIFRGLNHASPKDNINSSQVNRIYKKLASRIKLDKETTSKISGHSMRVGAAQELLKSGESLVSIMNKGRWSKSDTVMRYIEHTEL